MNSSSRILNFMVVLALLLGLMAAPIGMGTVHAQEAADCTPLTVEESAELQILIEKKADGLSEAEYNRLTILTERQDCAAAAAQPAFGGIESVSGYTFTSSAGAYVEIVGTVSTATGDDGGQNITLPFTFNYDGVNYTTGRISTNGWLEMGQSYTSSGYSNSMASTTIKPILAALWDDLYDDASSDIQYSTSGVTPNQVFTVQWKNIRWYGSGGTQQNFQIKLYETSNVIEFVYGTMNAPAGSPTASIGVNDATGGSGHFISVTPAAGTADTFSTTTANNSINAATNLTSGKTYTFNPPSGAPGCATIVSPADAATNVAASATLNWSAGSGGTPTSYDVYFGTSTPPSFVVNQAGTSYDPAGMMAYSTTHYWQIIPRNASGSATGCSIWSFTTEADPTITPPWLEPLTTYLPTNWSESTGLLANPTTLAGTTSAWYADGFANVGSTGSAAINIYGTSRREWLFTPPVNLGASGNYQLEFDLALTVYNGTGSATLGVDDKFAVVISTDGGATWTSVNTLRQWDSTTPISNGAGDHITINLSSYTGVVKFGFYGESTVSNADNDLFVDNVQVREAPVGPPDCAVIGAPADGATSVLRNADLSWSAAGTGGAPTSYDVYFGTSTPPGFAVNQAASPYDPGTMAYNTPYYWQIIPKNASGDASGCPIWSFTTEADPTITSFPYSQNFDSVTTPALPGGWTRENTNADSAYWSTYTTYRRGAAGNAAYVTYNGSLAMDDWLFTPPLQLTGGVTYGVRFFYKARSATYPESMELYWGSSNDSASMTNGPIFDDVDFNHITMEEGIATFTPATTGVYYLGFHGYSDANMYDLVLDDVTIYESPNTWSWNGATDTSWAVGGNWEGGIVPGQLDDVQIPAGVTNMPNMGSYTDASYGRVNNLTVDAHATLTLQTSHNLRVEGALTNNGALLQTRYIDASGSMEFLHITDILGTTDKYHGVDITNTNGIAMGDTLVRVQGNQTGGCTSNALDALLYRCFVVEPTSDQAATIRYWFTDAERHGQDSSQLKLWHYDGPGSWTQVGDTYTYSEAGAACVSGAPAGSACWFQAMNVGTYSPFGLGSGSQPTVIALRSFGATSGQLPVALGLIALAMVSGALIVFRRRK